jgi:serine/threonine protein kinase
MSNRKGLEDIKMIGEGGYGIVYKGTLNGEKVAIKRNFGDEDLKGIMSLRELDGMNFLRHPKVVSLKYVFEGKLFEKKEFWPKIQKDDMREDTHHFMMECADSDLDDFIETCTKYSDLKSIMCQLLIGLEFIHNKRILHRDIKPGNILVFKKKVGIVAKFCDFGVSCHPSKFRPSTPGCVTMDYRAPEICCAYKHYSYPSDIWSLGCVFYKMIMQKCFIRFPESIGNDECDQTAFKTIIETMPDSFTNSDINEFMNKGRKKYFEQSYTVSHFKKNAKGDNVFKFKNKSAKPFLEIIKGNVNVRKFNTQCGNISHFADLLTKMIKLNPEDRLTASECLNHKFFSLPVIKQNIKEFRESYPQKEIDTDIVIIDCIERKWAVNALLKIYNERKINKKFYCHQILFQSLRIFDECLCYKKEKMLKEHNPEPKVTLDRGKYFTKEKTLMIIHVCFYIMYKHFNTLSITEEWSAIFPSEMYKEGEEDDFLEEMTKCELFITDKVCKYFLYKPSFLDIITEEENSKKANDQISLEFINYFYNYSKLKDYRGSLKDLYSKIKTFLDS